MSLICMAHVAFVVRIKYLMHGTYKIKCYNKGMPILHLQVIMGTKTTNSLIYLISVETMLSKDETVIVTLDECSWPHQHFPSCG